MQMPRLGQKATICKNGHCKDEENTNRQGKCRICARSRSREFEERKKQERAVRRQNKVTRTHCKNGHELTSENIGKDGYCKICKYNRCKKSRELNPEKFRAYVKKWADTNRPYLKQKQRERAMEARKQTSKLKYRYGITYSDKLRMIDDQDNLCAICGLTFDNSSAVTRPLIDHNHRTKKVRGILCHHCNSGIGHFFDNVPNMLKAVEYLKLTTAAN